MRRFLAALAARLDRDGFSYKPQSDRLTFVLELLNEATAARLAAPRGNGGVSDYGREYAGYARLHETSLKELIHSDQFLPHAATIQSLFDHGANA